MNTDPIADLLTRIRNASRAGKSEFSVPHSKVKESILALLAKNSIVGGMKVKDEDGRKMIVVKLLPERSSISLTRKSKPGQRSYISSSEIRPIRNGYGIGIISTSQGIMTTDEAKAKAIGGEYICEIY